jgi:energy-coupling factor transporter ATP-binding protein EcfA2
MSSTTPAKKEIIDFLWEWAETKGDWAKLLIDKVVTSENELSSTERQEVFSYFLQSVRLRSGLPALNIQKPTYTPSSKQIELTSLSEVKGVNRLAPNQTIAFSKNLTVVFGENGTGKTGYARILKSLGFSYDTNNRILSNIFESSTPQVATIKYNLNGVEESPFIWDGTNRNEELQNISVFNNSCVQISLSDRQLIVSPIGFHLFSLVTSELTELTKFVDSTIKQYPTHIGWIASLTDGTPQKTFISQLSFQSTENRLLELSNFSSENEEDLTNKKAELSNLNKTLIQTEIRDFNASILEIDEILTTIQTAKTNLNTTTIYALIDFNIQISKLEKATNKGIKEIAESNGIEFYETPQFQSFIQSAEEYIKILGKPHYPVQKDICIYCLQPLQTSAKELLESYRRLLNDKTHENLSTLRKQKNNLIDKVKSINENINLRQPTFGVDENQKPIQPKEFVDFKTKLRTLKNEFVSDIISDASLHTIDYDEIIKFLSKKRELLQSTLTQRKELLTNLSSKETELKNQVAELTDRKFISSKIDEIKTAMKNQKITAILNNNASTFNTKPISTKTTEARDALVKSNFETIFKNELKSLRKSQIKIDLNFGTDRGHSKVSHKINAHSLLEILSEGEQKAIALSEFLTELQLDNIKAPVIFDDPVNSLDHNIIDDVARRLLRLSTECQVVIFTHSVLLFNSFLYFNSQPSFNEIACKFYNSRNEYDQTGIICEAEEEINKPKSYISKINTILNNTPKDRPEAEVAEDGYGYLRSAIELLVEHEIFQGTVKRYQKNIALTSFVKVNGSLVDVHKDKLNEIFERCCGYIKGHSNALPVYNEPTVAELNSDFIEFNKIRDLFIKK